MRRRVWSYLPTLGLLCGLAVGCSDDGSANADGNGDSNSSDSGDDGNSTNPSTTTTGAGDGAMDGGSDDGASFFQPPDAGSANECDPQLQDCPDGEKCTAWANDGGTFWNANRCVETSGTGQDGDQCMVEGSGVAGIDDCDIGFICMNTDEMGLGTCVKFCQGEDSDCEPGQVCAVYNDGVLPICLVQCDPLLQDCPNMQSCIDTPNGQFICFNDASGDAAGADGDPCPPEHGENSCDPGNWCGAGAAGCVDAKCCTPFCDVTADNCPAGDTCVSFFGDPMNAPPGLEDVGVCILP